MTPTKFQNHLQIASAPKLELKASPNGRIGGYASTTGGEPDRHGEIVMAGAFATTLARARAGELPVMLWSHRQESPIGRWTMLAEDERGLAIEGQLNLKTAAGAEAFEHIQAGDTTGLSIGFAILDGGREYVGSGVWHLKAVDVLEVSIVALPANPLARITSVKSLESKAELTDLLRSAGLSRKAATLVAAGGWRTLAGEEDQEKAAELAGQIDRAIKAIQPTTEHYRYEQY